MAGTQKKPAQFYLILVHIMCQIKYMHKVGFYQALIGLLSLSRS